MDIDTVYDWVTDKEYFPFCTQHKLTPVSSYYSEDYAFIDNENGRVYVFDVTGAELSVRDKKPDGGNVTKNDLIEVNSEEFTSVWDVFSMRYRQMYEK